MNKLFIENIEIKFKHLAAAVLNTNTNEVGFIAHVDLKNVYIRYNENEGLILTDPKLLKWL